jgi:superfamily I DNA and RNA helicase
MLRITCASIFSKKLTDTVHLTKVDGRRAINMDGNAQQYRYDEGEEHRQRSACYSRSDRIINVASHVLGFGLCIEIVFAMDGEHVYDLWKLPALTISKDSLHTTTKVTQKVKGVKDRH